MERENNKLFDQLVKFKRKNYKKGNLNFNKIQTNLNNKKYHTKKKFTNFNFI